VRLTRHERVEDLLRSAADLASTKGVRVDSVSSSNAYAKTFLGFGAITKYQIAE